MAVTAFLLQIIELLQDNAFSMSEPISDIPQVVPRGVGTHESSSSVFMLRKSNPHCSDRKCTLY
jgi:hypothetical protein